jgi:flagellar biosynthetic protein FliO
MIHRLCRVGFLASFMLNASGFAEEPMSYIDVDPIVVLDDAALEPPAIVESEGLVSSSIWAFLQMIVVLIAVVALAYLVLHKGVGSVMQRAGANKSIQVKERVALDQKRFLYLVEVANKRFLLGGGDHGVSLISDLTPPSPASEPTPISFSSSLQRGAAQAYDPKSNQMVKDVHAKS